MFGPQPGTPTPWGYERRKHETVILHSFKGADGYNNRIASCVQWSPAAMPQPTPDDAYANAAALVHRMNCWDEVCEALEFITNVARCAPGVSPMALKQADEALAKARGDEGRS